MSAKTNKLIIQEVNKDYSEKGAEETKETSQGKDEFGGEGEELEEARAEEITFDRSRAEERAARSLSHKARIMDGYMTGTENNPEEE